MKALKNRTLFRQKCFINGKWIGGKNTFAVTNPSTGGKLGEVPNLGTKETGERFA